MNNKQDKNTGKRLEALSKFLDMYLKGGLNNDQKELAEKLSRSKKESSLSDDEVKEGSARVWDRILAKIDFKNGRKTRTEERKKKICSVILFMHRYIAVAAIFIFILGGSLLLLKNTYQQTGQISDSTLATCSKIYYETKWDIKIVTLPDGSKIYLNKDSKLAFIKEEFNHIKREVWLDEGEAFFEVTKNPAKPFIVYCGNLKTVVRGTSFNVKAYKELKENTVSVRTGRVEIQTANKTLAILTPNKQLTYNKSEGTYESAQVDWSDAAAWMEGRLVLNNANAAELKLRFKQYFNVSLVIKSGVLSKAKFNASFQKGCTLQDALNVVGNLYGLKYTMDNNNVKIFN